MIGVRHRDAETRVHNLSLSGIRTYYVFAGNAPVLVHNCGGTVWDDIRGTQPDIPGSPVPKSFELTAGGTKVWVHPKVTDHVDEYLQGVSKRGGNEMEINMASQAHLASLQAAVAEAVKNGVPLNQLLRVGDWELKFSQRATDPLPVLKHGLYLGYKK